MARMLNEVFGNGIQSYPIPQAGFKCVHFTQTVELKTLTTKDSTILQLNVCVSLMTLVTYGIKTLNMTFPLKKAALLLTCGSVVFV